MITKTAVLLSQTTKSPLAMHRSNLVPRLRTISGALCASALCASAIAAQDSTKITVKKLGEAVARTTEPLGAVTSVRALSNGTLFVNDFPQRRIVMFDAQLKQMKIIADTLGTNIPYGQRQPGLIAFTADSTIIVDPATLALLVLNPKGEVSRVMSVPRPQDINTLATSTLGANAFDSKGQLIYRSQGGGGFGGFGGFGGMQGGNTNGGRGANQQQTGGGRGGAGGAGGRGGFGGAEDFPGGRPAGPTGPSAFGGNTGRNMQPDSLPLIRSNFDTRKTDTVTFVRVPKNEFATEPTPEGGTRVITKLNPLPQADDWATMSDGTVAVVRVLDYHIDWYTPDGKHTSSAKLPFDWKQLSDSDKTKMIDSLKAAAEIYTKQIAAMTQGSGNGSRIAFAPIDAAKLPDYYPPIRQGSTFADADGNLWILPATSSLSASDLLASVANSGRGGRGAGMGGGRGQGGAGGGAAGSGAAAGAAGAAGAAAGAGNQRGGAGGPPAGVGLEALLPPPSTISLNYDVVNRKGELVERVQLPPGRTIVGFGPKGAIYLSVREGRNMFIERYNRP